jgi:hypothetical protein
MYNYENKELNYRQQINYFLTRTLNMFEYQGLPDSLPAIELEKLLQKQGKAFITKVEDELYVFPATGGGEPNVYGHDTKVVVSNPYLNYNATLDISEDGVLVKSDDLTLGLLPLIEKYSYYLTENEISMNLATVNSRIQTLMSAGDATTQASAELYLKRVFDGKLGIIGENRIFEGIKVQTAQANSNSYVTHLIEYQQYVKASFYNEVGLNANFNMKRERLTSNETNLNIEALYPLIDDMLQCRLEAVDKLNTKYDLNVTVQFGSVWATRNINSSIDPELEPESELTIEPELEPIIEPELEPTIEPELEPTIEPDVTVDEVIIETLVDIVEDLDDIKEGLNIDEPLQDI